MQSEAQVHKARKADALPQAQVGKAASGYSRGDEQQEFLPISDCEGRHNNNERMGACSMNTPDWRKAPEGATHWGRAKDYWCEEWYSFVDQAWFVWWAKRWSLVNTTNEDWQRRKADLIPRSTQWRGPQDGMPPVGAEVEAKVQVGWERGTVVAIVNDGHNVFAIVQHTNGWNPYAAREMRPIQSDRDMAIEDMIGALKSQNEGVSELFYRETAAALYNAGYRKT